MHKKLTKGQMRELKAAMVAAGMSPDAVAEKTHPEVAWANYQILQRMKREQQESAAIAAVSDAELGPVAKVEPDAKAMPDVKRKGRGPGKRPKKVVTTVQLDPDILEGLQRVAEREERTVSAVIRLAVREYLERENG